MNGLTILSHFFLITKNFNCITLFHFISFYTYIFVLLHNNILLQYFYFVCPIFPITKKKYETIFTNCYVKKMQCSPDESITLVLEYTNLLDGSKRRESFLHQLLCQTIGQSTAVYCTVCRTTLIVYFIESQWLRVCCKQKSEKKGTLIKIEFTSAVESRVIKQNICFLVAFSIYLLLVSIAHLLYFKQF